MHESHRKYPKKIARRPARDVVYCARHRGSNNVNSARYPSRGGARFFRLFDRITVGGGARKYCSRYNASVSYRLLPPKTIRRLGSKKSRHDRNKKRIVRIKKWYRNANVKMYHIRVRREIRRPREWFERWRNRCRSTCVRRPEQRA
jgi:hypothetical protein